MSDTDMEEPPTKVSKFEKLNVDELEDEMDEGQEEWLSEGLLTDDDYNPTADQDQSNSNIGNTSIDETQVSVPSANTSMEDEIKQDIKIESIEKELTSMNSQGQVSKDLDTFLIRKADGKVVAKKEDLTDDGNDTDDLLRLLGEDDEKTKKKVLVKTAKGSKEKGANDSTAKKVLKVRHDSASTDDDDFVFEGAIMTKLKVAKNALIRNLPASKAVPEDMSDEDDDETDASSDEAKTMKKIFNVKKPSKLASKADSKVTETPSKTNSKPLQSQPRSMAKNTRSRTKLEHTHSPSPKQQRNISTASKSSPTVKSSPKTIVKPSPKTVVKPSPKSNVKASPKTIVKPTPKSNVKPSSKSVVKPSPKSAVKPSPKSVVKPSPKSVVKPSPKSNVKPSPKPVIKPSPKPSTKSVAKSSPKMTIKPASRPASKPSVKSTTRPVSKERQPLLSEPEEIINEQEFLEEDDFDLDEDFADATESEFDISRDRQLIMRPEQMDEEIPTDAESDLDDDDDSFDELPSSDSEDLDDWFTLDLRAERAAEYIPLLGARAYEMLLEEKRRVSDRLVTLRARVAELSDSGKRQDDLIKNASMTLTELDDMLKAT